MPNERDSLRNLVRSFYIFSLAQPNPLVLENQMLCEFATFFREIWKKRGQSKTLDCYSVDPFSISSGLAAGKASARNQGAESRPRSSGAPWNSHLAQEFRCGGLVGFLQNFLPIGEKICRKRWLDRQGRRAEISEICQESLTDPYLARRM